MPRPLAPCGTWSAYLRHKRRKEPVDEACRVAARKYEAGRARNVDDKAQDAPVIKLPAAAKSFAEPAELDMRRELLENMDLVKRAMSTIATADPLKIVTLSKRHSELVAELCALGKPGVGAGEPEEGDPFAGFFGVGSVDRRPASAPRKSS